MADKLCYMCGVEDPDKVSFDSEKHHLCLLCKVKLFELAKEDIEFDVRDSTVAISLRDELETRS